MKTKNNTFKRIAAGALATISVATNVMSANVGGSPFVDAIRASLVAQAAVGDEAQVDFSGINKYLTSFSNGTTTFDTNALSGLEGFKAKEGDTITVKSSIPLTFNKEVTGAAAHATGAVKIGDNYYTTVTLKPTITKTYSFTAEANISVNPQNENPISPSAPAANANLANYTFYKATNVGNVEVFNGAVYESGIGNYRKVQRYVDDPASTDQKYSVAVSRTKADYFDSGYFVADNVMAIKKQQPNNADEKMSFAAGEKFTANENDYKFIDTTNMEGKSIGYAEGQLIFVDTETQLEVDPPADANTKTEYKHKATAECKYVIDSTGALTTVPKDGFITDDIFSDRAFTVYRATAVRGYGDNGTSQIFDVDDTGTLVPKVVMSNSGNDVTLAAASTAYDVLNAVAVENAIRANFDIDGDATTTYYYKADATTTSAFPLENAAYNAAEPDEVYVLDNIKVGYAEINDNFYEVVEEAANGVTEAAALKDGKVYATKSGNSFVYTYKVTSAVKIVGQKTTVEITNGLPTAYDAEAYKNLDDDAKALCAWGDTTDNALLKGIRPVVSDLKFVSDLEPAAPINEYDENIPFSTNVTGYLDAYKNENVVLSSSNYFKVRIWDGKQKTAYKEYATTFNSKANDGAGAWECTFPAYVDAEGDKTRVLVEKADPVYTYTTNGSVLKVSGSGIDEEAAYIKAYAVPKKDQATLDGKPTKPEDVKKYAITSDASLTNESMVYVDLARIAEFASATNTTGKASTLKITRNGKEIKADKEFDAEHPAAHLAEGTTEWTDDTAGANKDGAFVTNQPGEYEITYTVYINANKTTAVAKELKFKFTIETKSKLTASNVKLKFSAEPGLITGADKDGNLVVTGAENLKLPVNYEDLKNKSINVTATLVDAEGNDLNEIKVILSGATTVNELNLSQPLYITYNDDQYSTGSETIVVNWQAVSKAKQFNIFQPDGEKPLYTEAGVVNGNNYEVNVSVDEIADIQKIVESNYVLKNGDAKKISYEYSVGKGDKLESQELDWHEAGFPKEIGEYSLYILYANEPIAIVDLNVIKHSLHAAPTDAQLNITYGDKLFTEEELGYADAQGNAVKDAAVKNPEIKFYATNLLDDAQVKQIVDGKFEGATVYEKDGKYYTKTADSYNNAALLNAGVYVAEIKAKNGNATTVGKSDYTLMSDTFVLNVAKKQITADMITIAPKNYIADYHTIGNNAGDIVGKDTAITKNFAGAPTEVKLKIASGEQSGKNIGGYTVNVTVDDKENNYTGTVKNFKWYIIKGAEKDGENYSGLFWNDTETTIVDNGNINVEFGKSANLVGEVVEFGFIGDKSGKIGAPTKGTYTANKSSGIYNYSNNFNATTGAALDTEDADNVNADPNVQAAYSELVYGAGINPAKQNAAMIAKKGADTFGVSVRIEDANTGVWVRPYLILKVDGEEKLYYGEVRYLNLVEEATAMLNLKASAIADEANDDGVAQPAFTKDQAKAQYADNSDLAYMEDAKSGYWAEKNQFYAYAHYNFDKNSKVKDSAIQGFGVVLDKNGYIPAYDADADNAGEVMAKAKEVLIPANKGKNGILSGISKDNPKMLKNEMGVAVNPKDAVTGVWLRSFVDFGNGLIVYTDPVYIKSVSEQYAACKPGVVGEKAANAAKINYTVTANAVVVKDGQSNSAAAAVIPKFKGANAVIKEAGVVVDKNGTLFKLNDAGYYTGWVDDIKTKFIADNATANGYNKGKKGIDINPATVGTTIFTGHAFQVTNKSGNYIKTVARPFVVYTINGKDITIYGDPVVDETRNTTYPQQAMIMG